MSGANAVAVVVSLAAGIGSSVQAAIVGRLGNRIGSIEALGFSMLVAGASGVALLLVVRQSADGIASAVRQPVWLWLGGALSAFIVLSFTVATPRIGVTAVIALAIAGQLLMAAVIDALAELPHHRGLHRAGQPCGERQHDCERVSRGHASTLSHYSARVRERRSVP